MAIWISAEVPDAVAAAAFFIIGTMAWMIGPFSLTVFLPRFGIRLPDWLAAANWWLVSSSPVSVAFRIATGLEFLAATAGPGRADDRAPAPVDGAVHGRGDRPVAAGPSRHRRASTVRRGDGAQASLLATAAPAAGRRRPDLLEGEVHLTPQRPPERHGALDLRRVARSGWRAATFYYARPAFVEVWRNGYASAATEAPGARDEHPDAAVPADQPAPAAPSTWRGPTSTSSSATRRSRSSS